MSLSKISILFFMIAVLPLAAAVNVGDQAPNFTLTDHTGQSFNLAQKLGNPVVLFFMGYS